MTVKANIQVKRYVIKIPDDTSDLIYAMRLIVCWKKMRNICLSRRECKGCQFYESGICQRRSTDSVLEEAREIFEKHLKKI